MKNLLVSFFKANSTSKYSMLGILFATALLSVSCTENPFGATSNTEVEPEVKATITDNIHVAFAGGGWRAHTAHTAWTMSLLENNNHKLDNVFKNVESIGSNSGGSWFSTMLMYSPKFVSDIETIPLADWGDTKKGGWLGGQQNLFNDASVLGSGFACYAHAGSGDTYLLCVIGYYSGKHLNWNEAIKSLVFKDYSLGNLGLNTKPQKWASGKSLLIASTMLTNNIVLNSSSSIPLAGYNQYYQACVHGTASTHGKHGGSCSNGIANDVRPVTFSSVPSHLTSPPFFPELGTGKQISFAYSEQANNPYTGNATIKNPVINDQVEIMHAAAASSAALGFAASENISGGWDRSYATDNLALNFSLKNGVAKYDVAQDGTSVSDLASSVRVSLADGGPTDNSGVAQLIPFLQLNNKDTGFNIVAFDNVQGHPFVPGENGAAVGNDIATLFGEALCLGDKFCTGFNCDGTCVTVPELQIFESAPIETPITWSYSNEPSKYKNAPRLIYTKYIVKTTDNATFGIKKGSTGTLHAFTCYYPDAPTEPQNITKDGSFKAYNEMMQFINTGLKANNNKGLTLLEKALGLK
ncbi:hypothetical protein ACFO3O_02340 [Dokdonia ponticola]|uniref:Patatin-like phospholipase family protein n=1 Tax=Dokdonia ponticola TaxID=2041041 RepID=A0ABV9HTG4_9FLAO